MVDEAILRHSEVDQIVRLSLQEDHVLEDVTSKAAGLRDREEKVRATVIAKESTVVSGFPLVERIFEIAEVDQNLKVSQLSEEGKTLGKNSPWFILEGKVYDILRLERVLLNFLQRTSGISTLTRKFAEKLEGTDTKLLHTRKTVPGHRRIDIYASLVGGAHLHRKDLSDGILVKENHLHAVKDFQTLNDGIVKHRDQAKYLVIEVSNRSELKHSLLAKPDRILLDNFSVEETRKVVNLFGSSIEFESSGGITLENVKAYAETGVAYISVGAITHSPRAADLSLLLDHKL